MKEPCMSEMRESGQKLNDETIFSFRNKSNRSCTNLWKAEEEKIADLVAYTQFNMYIDIWVNAFFHFCH